MTSEQRAAVAVHNATQNRMCLNLSGNGQICVACSEVADQIDAAVEVERQRSQEALAAARLAYQPICERVCGDDGEHVTACIRVRAALAAPANGDSK